MPHAERPAGTPGSFRPDPAAAHSPLARWHLPLLLLLAFILRLAWMLTQLKVIDNDGAEYARIGQNLLAGNGYIGLLGNPQLVFPMLYPTLIAVVTALTHNAELAGRLVSLVAGTALVFAVHGLVNHEFGRRPAFFAALLTAVHPLLVHLSGSVLSEATYLTLWIIGLGAGLRAVHTTGRSYALVAGIAFGLAFLSRPEGAAFVPYTIVAIWLVAFRKKRITRALQASVILAGASIVLALPQVVHHLKYTGRTDIGAKADINLRIVERMEAGMSRLEAIYGINDRLEQEGPLLDPEYTIRHAGAIPLFKTLQINAVKNTRALGHALLRDAQFAGPVLLLLALLGILYRWNGNPGVPGSQLYLIGAAALTFVVLLGVPELRPRYIAQFLPLLAIWAGRGMALLPSREQLFSRSASRAHRLLTGLAVVAASCILLGMFALAYSNVQKSLTRSPAAYHRKEAGWWLGRSQQAPFSVMCTGTTVPFYADALWMPIPYASPETMLRYLAKKNPDFVVVGRNDEKGLPFAAGWLENGIPDARAHLVYAFPPQGPRDLAIFRWTH